MDSPHKDPETPKAWQDSVDYANGALMFEKFRMCGMFESDLNIPIDRCIEILERGKELGYSPSNQSIEVFCKVVLGKSPVSPESN